MNDKQTDRGFKKVSRHIAFDDHLDLAPFCSRFAWVWTFPFLCRSITAHYRISAEIFSARQHICYSALYAIARPSVRPSVRHTGGSVKDGWS